ncbi:hypothetical protein PHPALM_30804 [Phytophthora palmivora]|uniref:Uncharacterized protein n=1 Tax=Phytophthora palmivora TaxID=4796 RepID=A0A2P4X473_9STRA|nr:hypothetical protein PHPALM_30804 [Phytophthora palmivora]
MESQLLPVLIRVVERREQWLAEQGVSVDSGKVSVEQGVQVILEYLEKEHITSVTEERLKAVWHESEQEAVDEIIALIRQGIDVKSPDEDAALRYAAKNGFISVVSLLLERSANAATHDEDGKTALHCGAGNGHTEVVSLLLKHGADVAATNNDDETALHCAYGHTEVVSLLLQYGADIAAKTKDGWTALHLAAHNGHTEVVSFLLKQGADVATTSNDGRTALHLAARNGHTEVVSFLLKQGADVATTSNDGLTALHSAARNGHTEVVSLLFQHGADVVAKANNSLAILHYAAINGHTEVVSLLLQLGADVSASDKDNMTTFHYAAYNGHTELVSFLLQQGADIATETKGRWTALHLAAYNGHTEIVSLLLKQGADVVAILDDGGTALHYAAHNGHTEVVSFLLKQGAVVATTSNSGRTALHLAARNGHTEVVSVLLKQGADVAASDNVRLAMTDVNEKYRILSSYVNHEHDDRLTVLHHAVTSGSTKVVSLLLDNGANAHVFTKEGHNALTHMILVKHDNPGDDYLSVVRLLCSQKQKLKLPPSTQTPPLEKHQLGMLACAQYWQDRYENNEPLLEVPSEVVKGGEGAVLSYLADLEKTDARELVYRQKICVVGPSTWGKTSLIKSMTEEAPVDISPGDRTIGIDLFSLKLMEEGDPNTTEVRHHDVTFWDFAGQEVYHAAHAIFFSKRTLYLVCIDLQAYDKMLKEADAKVNLGKSILEPERIKQRFFEEQILRWMILILFRQPNAQFKLIGTKHDLLSGDASRIAVAKDVKRRLQKFLEGRDDTGKMSADVVSSIRKEFNLADRDGAGNITSDAFSSLRKELSQELVTAGRGNVESAKEAIEHLIFTKTDLSFKMPATYAKVLKNIKKLRSPAATDTQQDQMTKLIMPVNELCDHLIMEIPGLEDEMCVEILQVLHNLGDILWYERSGDSMDELVILDPSVMLDLVREVVNHDYENKADERYKVLWRDGTLPHSLLMTFPKWKCLDSMGKNGELVRRFKRLLHHLNLVYPANDMDSIDEADIIVPMYWKTREKAKKALKPLTKQNTILDQNFGGNSYIAKWRYSLPIAISEAVFVNFVVKCYRPYVHREVRETHFESSVHGEFHAAVYLRANETGHYDDITIEVAASTKKLAWAEMMYFVIDMECILKKNYPGLAKLAKLQRFMIDDQGNDRDLKLLLGSPMEEERLLETKAPWLPPDFEWFIRRAWETPGVLDKYRLLHRVEVLKKLVVTKDKRRLPVLWSLAYPKKGEPVEMRIHSDFSGKCWHEPLKIQITDNFFTNHSQFVQVGISVLSVVSAAIPIPVVSAAAAQILAETKSALNQATTVKTIVDQAHLGPGEKKSSNELDMWPTKRTKFLLALLAEHDPPLDERTVGGACKLCRVATGDGQYLWVNEEELDRLKHHIMCEPETYVPINPTAISLSITGTTGSWDAKSFTKMYCEWKFSHGIKDPDDFSGATKKAAITSTGATWESNVNILKVTSIKELRDCTLQVWVKQTRRLTGCFRNDKLIAKGAKQFDNIDENCSKTQTIDVPIDVGEATSPRRTVNCQITIEF